MYRIVKVTEGEKVKYKIQKKDWLFGYCDITDNWYGCVMYVFDTMKEADEQIKKWIDFENRTEEVVKVYN